MQIKNVRWVIAIMTTFGAYAVYVGRVNLSIAIIAMVDDHAHDELNTKPHDQDQELSMAGNFSSLGSNSPNATVPINLHEAPNLGANSIFPTSKKSIKSPLISQDKFNWDQTEQGHILGAFFYGYILFQIPGARIAESVGAKWILLTGIFSSAVISLIFPLSTQLNSLPLLMFLRFLMGLSQSAFFPAAYVLFCRWLPEKERSILLPIMFIGSNVGSISTYIMSSYLISSAYGWPSVFYVSGLVCLIISVFWFIFVSSEPGDNWLITNEEYLFIKNNVNNQTSELNSLKSCSISDNELNGSLESIEPQQPKRSKQFAQDCCLVVGVLQPNKLISNDIGKQIDHQQECNSVISSKKQQTTTTTTTPQPVWSKLLKSIPIWTLVLSMYGNEWSNVVICYELPTYLNTALNFPIEQNGVINSFFQLSFAVASPIMSSLGAYALDKHLLKMRKIHVRKLFQSLATFGQMICFLSVPICGSNRGLIIMFMFAAIIFKSCANAGDIMVSGDLSPEYAGTLFAFANSIGNTAGFFVPLLVGALVSNPYDKGDWTPFWLTTATIMGLSGTIFLIFGVTSRQEFGADPLQANLMELELELTSSSDGEELDKSEKSFINCQREGIRRLTGNK